MRIKSHLRKGFETNLLEAAIRNSEDEKNQLRANNFAYAMRSLLDFFLERVAPKEEIKRCPWYIAPSEDEVAQGAREINLRQKIKYAIQGGFPDGTDILEEFQINEKIRDLKNLHNDLSSFTHISPSSLERNQSEHEQVITNFNEIMDEFFTSFDALRDEILNAIDRTYVEDIVQESFMDDYHQHLADMGAETVESSYVETHKVLKITSSDIIFQIEGMANCEHRLGGNKDYIEMPGSYQFKVNFYMKLSNKNEVLLDSNSFVFDTTSWHGEDVYGFGEEQ